MSDSQLTESYLEYAEWRRRRYDTSRTEKIYAAKPKRLKTLIPHTVQGKIAKRLLKSLAKPLGLYVFHVSPKGSVYLKFKDPKMRSIRIADHPGKLRYPYKWNVQIRYTEALEGNRFAYTPDELPQLVTDLLTAGGKT